MSLFNRATMGGDSLVAGELFDVLLQITHSAKAQAEDGKETEKTTVASDAGYGDGRDRNYPEKPDAKIGVPAHLRTESTGSY